MVEIKERTTNTKVNYIDVIFSEETIVKFRHINNDKYTLSIVGSKEEEFVQKATEYLKENGYTVVN